MNYDEKIKVKVNRKLVPCGPGMRCLPISLEPTPVLGYFCGLVLGDGCLHLTNRCYRIELGSPDPELVNNFFNAAKTIGMNPYIMSEQRLRVFPNGRICTKPYQKVVANSKILYQALRPHKQKDYKWSIPGFLTTQESLLACLSGIFDADGNVSKLSYSGITLASKHKENLALVQKILRRFAIESRIYRTKQGRHHILRIKKRKSVEFFQKLIGFKLPRKKALLEEILGGNS